MQMIPAVNVSVVIIIDAAHGALSCLKRQVVPVHLSTRCVWPWGRSFVEFRGGGPSPACHLAGSSHSPGPQPSLPSSQLGLFCHFRFLRPTGNKPLRFSALPLFLDPSPPLYYSLAHSSRPQSGYCLLFILILRTKLYIKTKIISHLGISLLQCFRKSRFLFFDQKEI